MAFEEFDVFVDLVSWEGFDELFLRNFRLSGDDDTEQDEGEVIDDEEESEDM